MIELASTILDNLTVDESVFKNEMQRKNFETSIVNALANLAEAMGALQS